MTNKHAHGGTAPATGLRRLWNATGYSLRGIRAAFTQEAAFRQECALVLVLAPAAFWVGTSAVEVLLLLATLFVVLITELLNSALETIVDRIGTEHHELSGRAKDIGSAAVMLSLALGAVVWLALLWQHL